MEQNLPTNKNKKYNELLYSEWNFIPPNLPLPNTTRVYTLQLTFLNILYLQQMRQEQTLDLKLLWWGMKGPHSLSFNNQSEKPIIAKYVVCCPLQGLFSYFSDTKLLAIDIGVKQRILGKAYLNFLVLKGWQGQRYEGLMDIKKQKKKIGQISYSIQIIKDTNPFLSFSATQQIIDHSTITKINATNKVLETNNKKKNQNIMEDKPLQQNQVNTRNLSGQRQTSYKRKTSLQSETLVKDNKQQFQAMFNYTQIPKKQFQTVRSRLDMINQETNIKFNLNNYQMEMVRLIQDYKLLFQRKQHIIDLEHPQDNAIELEIVNLELLNKQQNKQIEITLPLANGQQNIYKLGIGSYIKVCISQLLSRDQIISYLKECMIQFKCSLAQGTIQLSKVLSKINQVVVVPLYQKDKKNGKSILKGHCFLKAIPPMKQPSKPQVNKDNTVKKQQTIESPQIKQELKQQYVLIFIKSFNLIEPLQRKINILSKIFEQKNNVFLGETKTLWNCSQHFIFQDKLTFQIKSNSFLIQMIDRQKYQNIMGEGICVMEGAIGINKQVPIIAKRMNRNVIIGYLSIDFVKNGLQSVTKMVDILGKTCNHQKTNQIKNERQKQRQKENIEEVRHQDSEIKENDIQENQQQISKQNKKQQQKQIELNKNRQEHKNKVSRQFERNMSELQIYNKFFTFIYNHNHIMHQLIDKSEVKITQFLKIFQEIQNKQILTVKQLNLIISQHLFTNQSSQIHIINVNKLKESFDAFCTYYEEITEQRDTILLQFLHILENVGLSINQLQYKLKNNRKIWEKLNQFLSYGKGEKINIVEDLRIHFQQKKNSQNNFLKEMTGAQFCDLLRKYEVYQTTLGMQIHHTKLAAHIYQHLCKILSQIEPQISSFTYRQLFSLLQHESLVLSEWQLVNLAEHMNGIFRKTKPIIEVPNKQTNKFNPTEIKRQQHQIKQNISLFNNKPTITKSPTFGYLQPLEAVKGQSDAQENQMVESLAVKMHNLAISPINYNSSKQVTKELKALFSNLRYKPTGLSIDQKRIQFNLTNNYWSKDSEISKKDNIISKNYQSQNNQKDSLSYMENKTIKSYDDLSRKDFKSNGSSKSNQNIEVTLDNINKKFNYLVSIDFEQEDNPITVQCLHQEWTALLNEEGDYLGGILIY